MKILPNFTRSVLCAGLVALAWVQAPAAAAASLALAKSFEGNINIAGTQASLQSKSGGAKACDLASGAQAGLSLPSGATVVSAQLYWAGTGSLDPEVSLNNVTVTAAAERRYTSSIDGLSYFTAAADVTALVQGKTTFSFGGLNVSTADIYCAKQQKDNAMVAGFALVVVYSHASERYRTVNVYEGLQAIKNASVTVSMPDYTPPAANAGSGRFGYIVWEGDRTGQQKGDYVSFAGTVLSSEPFVHKDNAFNSKSSVNADENSGGIDFDIVDVAAPPASAANAKAVFTTTSDRVLLGVAVSALPSKPADLAIKKTQAGEFKVGSEITYTLSVSNEGARADSQVKVTDSLPAALAYVSAAGADWSCTVSGQTVTCQYGKPLAPGATASVQIKARVSAEGRIVNSAEVTGTADSVPGNNRSTVEGDTGGQQVTQEPFAFTVGPCTAGTVVKASGGGCALFAGPVTAGSRPTIYITHLVGGVATPLSTTTETSKTVNLSLQCNNPADSAGTTATYAGTALSSCLADSTAVGATSGKDATLKWTANEVSKAAEFYYPDVGIVTLRMRDSAGNIASASFASLPASLRAAYRRADGVANPGKLPLADPAFAEAGEPFQAAVSAYGQDGIGPLPNFGRERGDFALSGRLELLAQGDELEQRLLVPQDAWSGEGTVARTFVWNEAGMAQLAPVLSAYLGTDLSLQAPYSAVGRFYPQYFKTEIDGGFACLKRMNCPPDGPNQVARAAYSGQPFGVVVRAYGRNGVLQRFDAPLVPEIRLSAVAAPGEDGELGKFENGEPAAATARQLGYRLAKPWNARAGSREWTAPTAVYVRALAPELRATAGGSAAVEIRSQREKGTASMEAGIMVVNGRLMVGHTIGTPLARTAVPLRAQFWSGQAWEQNSVIDDSKAVMGSVDFSGCRRGLRLNTSSDACDPAVLKLVGAASGTSTVALPMLQDGKSSLVLAPVGERSGNVDLFVNGYDYLPSTIGRVTFGQFKSPVIYVREMY
ncbi:DUF6701 domain-containing protein [Massilia sp. X63]|uniref:DUF6701 domain-containing protein n=1 Tax=Massilia sp. X63 TaxID=3237285 RepID=UPI0034DD7A40